MKSYIDLLYIPVQGNARKARIQPSLGILQAWVGGDIEELKLPDAVMIMCEYRVDGVNTIASKLAGREIWGDVLVAGGVDEKGELTPYAGPIPRPTGRRPQSI